MTRLSLLISLFLTGLDPSAQSYRPGYFVTLDHKHVKGTIKFSSTQSLVAEVGHDGQWMDNIPTFIKKYNLHFAKANTNK
jgi:hypothetical protein